jgi:hypothetical protein
MTLLVTWLVFPALLAVLATGCGLLVERVAGLQVPRPLLPGLGLAVLILAGQLTTLTGATAELTTPVVLALAVGGFVAAAAWRARPRPDPAPLLAALAVFAVFAAPVVLSGEATVAGYIKLDDTASWLGITSWIMEHGLSLDGLAPSSYEAMLDFYIGSDYPVGVFIPFAVGSELLGQNVAWLYQPWVAFVAAQLALALYVLAERLIDSRAARAGVALIAAQPALLFGFGQWGGAKEVAAAWALALLAAFAPLALGSRLRGVVPAGIVSAATLAILSVGGGIWVLPPLLLTAAAARAQSGLEPTLRKAGALACVAIPLSLPPLLATGFLSAPAASTITDRERLANLIQPLSELQVFGIWPVDDFRLRPDDLAPTYVLIAVVLGGIVLGVLELWRRRRDGDTAPAIYCGAAATGCLIVVAVGSPWVTAKALAIASPAFLLLALVGVYALHLHGHSVPAAVAAIAIAGGVIWSNVLGYGGINLGPRDRFAELEEIGERFAGQGPALMTEYEPFGVRHFLGSLDPEGASELRRRQVPLRTGRSLGKAQTADIDEFALSSVLVYRTLVLRRSPVASRPPSQYALAWSGRWYEVWQRAAAPKGAIVEHLPLGGDLDPAAMPRCGEVRRLAALAREGRLAAVPRPAVTVVDPSQVPRRPPEWTPSETSAAVEPRGGGTLRAAIELAEGGPHEVWVGESFRGGLVANVDGKELVSERHLLSHGGQYVPLERRVLAPGNHQVEVELSGEDLHPGSRGSPPPLGPLALTTGTADLPVTYVAASQADSLCGRRLDWIEAVSAGP